MYLSIFLKTVDVNAYANTCQSWIIQVAHIPGTSVGVYKKRRARGRVDLPVITHTPHVRHYVSILFPAAGPGCRGQGLACWRVELPHLRNAPSSTIQVSSDLLRHFTTPQSFSGHYFQASPAASLGVHLRPRAPARVIARSAECYVPSSSLVRLVLYGRPAPTYNTSGAGI